MAQIVYLNRANTNGGDVLRALDQIRTGIESLRKLDGLRAESIGAGAAVMARNFAVTDPDGAAQDAHAQALSDRIGAFLGAYDDGANAEFAKMRDLLNATSVAP